MLLPVTYFWYSATAWAPAEKNEGNTSFAPDATIEGAILALKELDPADVLVLFGDKKIITDKPEDGYLPGNLRRCWEFNPIIYVCNCTN